MLTGENLADFKLFSGIEHSAIDRIIACGEVCSFKPESVVVEESSTTSELFLLLSGRVTIMLEVTHFEHEAKKKQLAVLNERNFFGEMAFLGQKRRSAYVIARDDIEVLKLNGHKLEELFNIDTRLAYLVMRNMAAVLAQRIVDINFRWRDDI